MSKFSQQSRPVEAPKVPPPVRLVSLTELRAKGLPDKDTFFRSTRAGEGRGWAVEVFQASTGERFELDPWDTIDTVDRRLQALVGEAARK